MYFLNKLRILALIKKPTEPRLESTKRLFSYHSLLQTTADCRHLIYMI